MSFLFAYGSLRTGASPAEIAHLVARLKRLGAGRLPGRLYYLGRYPGAIFDASVAGTVAGEVFQLADDALLAEIDAYEGYDPGRPNAGEYVRRKVAVEVAGHGAIDCWVYELRQLPRNIVLIEAGDYLEWLGIHHP